MLASSNTTTGGAHVILGRQFAVGLPARGGNRFRGEDEDHGRPGESFLPNSAYEPTTRLRRASPVRAKREESISNVIVRLSTSVDGIASGTSEHDFMAVRVSRCWAGASTCAVGRRRDGWRRDTAQSPLWAEEFEWVGAQLVSRRMFDFSFPYWRNTHRLTRRCSWSRIGPPLCCSRQARSDQLDHGTAVARERCPN